MKVLELFSGIGGMHYGLKASGIAAQTVGAVDINDLANKVYRHNFPGTNLMQRAIEGITQKEFIKLDADMLLMSPPCQPFTRQGLQGDSQDARTKSFFYVMDMLPRLPKSPTYILVENVKGFETSNTRNYLVKTLEKCDYNYEEYLLSPVHLGIPNQRLRYFLLAKKCPLEFVPAFSLATDHLLQDHLVNSISRYNCKEDEGAPSKKMKSDKCDDASQRISSFDIDTKPDTALSNILDIDNSGCEPKDVKDQNTKSEDASVANISEKQLAEGFNERVASESSPETLSRTCHTCSGRIVTETQPQRTHAASNLELTPARTEFVLNRRISDYLEDLDKDELTKYLIPDKVLVRYGRLMDIVTSGDERTNCFTKGYGHKAEGSGSVLQVNKHADRATAFSSIPQDRKLDTPADVLQKLHDLQLRYFTPREIARMHHLPEEFTFPVDVSVKQCYRVLGNSLNAYVVSVLIQYLVT